MNYYYQVRFVTISGSLDAKNKQEAKKVIKEIVVSSYFKNIDKYSKITFAKPDKHPIYPYQIKERKQNENKI